MNDRHNNSRDNSQKQRRSSVHRRGSVKSTSHFPSSEHGSGEHMEALPSRRRLSNEEDVTNYEHRENNSSNNSKKNKYRIRRRSSEDQEVTPVTSTNGSREQDSFDQKRKNVSRSKSRGKSRSSNKHSSETNFERHNRSSETDLVSNSVNNNSSSNNNSNNSNNNSSNSKNNGNINNISAKKRRGSEQGSTRSVSPLTMQEQSFEPASASSSNHSKPEQQEHFEPRRIKKTEGDRIKLVLGETAETYVLLLDQDDGHTIWQTIRWAGPGVPTGLSKQLQFIQQEGLYVMHVAFAPDNRWFIQTKSSASGGRRRGSDPAKAYNDSNGTSKSSRRHSTHFIQSENGKDDNTSHNSSTHTDSWWGGLSKKANVALEQWTDSPHALQVSFGENGQCFILQGLNGHWDVGVSKVEVGLRNRVEKRYKDGGKVDFVRMFPFETCPNSYVVSDSEGTKWYGLNDLLAKELRTTAVESRVCDVAMTASTVNLGYNQENAVEEENNTFIGGSSGEQWAIFYPRHYKMSDNFPSNLKSEIAHFYRVEKARRLRRDAAIEQYHSRFQMLEQDLHMETTELKEEVDTLQHQRQEDLEQIVRLKTALLDEQEKNHDLQHNSKEPNKNIGSASQIISPPSALFKMEQRVTIANQSANPGDAFITDINKKNNTCIVTMDDGKVIDSIPLNNLTIYDEQAHIQNLQRDLDQMERDYWNKRVEINARSGNYFYWRALRSNECVKSSCMIVAKNCSCTNSLETTVLNSSGDSQYVHVTSCPKIAMYYAYNTHNMGNSRIRIAQIDASLIPSNNIFDVSSLEKCQMQGIQHPHAESYATANQLVLIQGTIPAHAFIVHDIPIPSSLSRSSGLSSLGSFVKFFPDTLSKLVDNWQRDVLQFILEQECDALGTTSNNDWVYPQHILALAKLSGKFAANDEDDHVLWKIILRHKATKQANFSSPQHMQKLQSKFSNLL